MSVDNPAYRLLNIINELKTNAVKNDPQARTALKQVFNIAQGTAADNDATLYIQIGKMLSLVNESTEIHKKKWPGRQRVNFHWSKNVLDSFSAMNLNEPISRTINRIDLHSIDGLESCAISLESVIKVEHIDLEKLTEWKRIIENLLDEVVTSGQDEEIVIKLSRILRKLITAIDEYKITGSPELLYSIEYAVGAVMLNAPTISYMQENSEFSSKFKSIIETMANTVSVITAGPAIGEMVVPALEYLTKLSD